MLKNSIKGNKIIVKDDTAEIIIESKKYGLIKTYIDKEDVYKISKYTWLANYDKKKNNYYIKSSIRINNKQKVIRLSNLILNNTVKYINCDSPVVDHINGNTLDNRKINLRICSQRENSYHNKRNTSGMRGVTWHKIAKKWQVKICKNKKCIFSKLFSSFDEAKNARIMFEKKVFGGG